MKDTKDGLSKNRPKRLSADSAIIKWFEFIVLPTFYLGKKVVDLRGNQFLRPQWESC